MNRLRLILAQRRYRYTALLALLAYALLYLTAAQLLVWEKDGGPAEEAVQISGEWRQLVLRPRAPFLYEPIGVVALGSHLRFYLAIPNVGIALFLGALVGLNAAVAYHDFRAAAFRGAKGFASLLGTLPALAGGAACCVPALALTIGLQMSAMLLAVWSLLVPASAALLVATLWWALAHHGHEPVCR